MKHCKMLISLPESMKQQLDALRAEGYTVSGYIRHVVEALVRLNTQPTTPSEKAGA
ncbi:MAG: hypothetical protein NTX84_03250 [Nitrospirae bacterium]|nr:hypothetical protein [Nitrospirota bacterium]